MENTGLQVLRFSPSFLRVNSLKILKIAANGFGEKSNYIHFTPFTIAMNFNEKPEDFFNLHLRWGKTGTKELLTHQFLQISREFEVSDVYEFFLTF